MSRGGALGTSLDFAGSTFLRRCVFLDPHTLAERVWAIDLALRSSAVTCVVADGSGLDMAQSRRLQLAAAAGGALAILVRPPWEMNELSAAQTRWLVRASPAPHMDANCCAHTNRFVGADRFADVHRPAGASHRTVADRCAGTNPAMRWTVHLLRCKGMQPFPEDARSWTVQRDHATGDVRVVSPVPDRSPAPTRTVASIRDWPPGDGPPGDGPPEAIRLQRADGSGTGCEKPRGTRRKPRQGSRHEEA